MKLRLTLFTLLAVHLTGLSLLAALRMPSVFSDRMVVQAEQPWTIWGWAEPGEPVTVQALDRVASAIADSASGRWEVEMAPLPAGKSLQVKVVSGADTVVIDDVLTGEVWLASGQSNMEWTMNRLKLPEAEKVAANYPKIRIFTAERVIADEPRNDVAGEWKICAPHNAGEFSAVAYHFARELHGNLEAPVGIVVSAYGGSPAEAWMSEEALRSRPEFAPILDRLGPARETYPAVKQEYDADVAAWEKARAAARAAGETAPRKPSMPRVLYRHKWPHGLYNGMLLPLNPYTIRGVIWYQGEDNATRAHQYETLFPKLISSWRELWKQEDLPFLFVQLANYKKRAEAPGESDWAELRDAQRKTLSVPNTAMAVAIDIGEANDIHPKNKKDVGRRLALGALATVYGHEVPYMGPRFVSLKTGDGEARVTFDHTYGGLAADGDRLEGFSVAGEDRQFFWADAVIEGDEVVLRSQSVPAPVAVRYGWADNPACNLYNNAGLPASPFRTDDWPGITEGNL